MLWPILCGVDYCYACCACFAAAATCSRRSNSGFLRSGLFCSGHRPCQGRCTCPWRTVLRTNSLTVLQTGQIASRAWVCRKERGFVVRGVPAVRLLGDAASELVGRCVCVAGVNGQAAGIVPRVARLLWGCACTLPVLAKVACRCATFARAW